MSAILPPRTARFLRRRHVAEQAKAVALYINGDEIDRVPVDPTVQLHEVVADMLIGIGEEYPGASGQIVVERDGADPELHNIVIGHAPASGANAAGEATRMMRVLTNALSSHLSRLERHNMALMRTQIEMAEELRKYSRANAKLEFKREGRREEYAARERRDALIDKYVGVLVDRADEVLLGALGQKAQKADQAGESTAVVSMRDKYVRLKLREFMVRKTPEQRAVVLEIFSLPNEAAIDSLSMAELRRRYESMDVAARDKLISILTPQDISLIATIDEAVQHATEGTG